MKNLKLRKATENDLQLLHEITKLAYSENFANHWEEGGLQGYLDHEYSIDVLQKQLRSNETTYFIASDAEKPIGFMKLNFNSMLPEYINSPLVELEKIYIRKSWHGKGIGSRMIQLAKDQAKMVGKPLFLDVIETNERAISVYKKEGFVVIGKKRMEFPLFKAELRGMWIMLFQE
jgi:diamine N-acetyltransferase